jgi:hypothetical protein
VELLDREPAAAELRRGTRALVAGRGEGLVIGAIAGTAENYVRSGGSNESFVRSLYVDLLGRQADAAGLARSSRSAAPSSPGVRAATSWTATTAGRASTSSIRTLGSPPTTSATSAPQDYLKITQLAIGATLGFLPFQSVDGSNLFTISREAFEQWVEKTIAEGEDPRAVLEIFSDKKGLADAAAVADYLWANVERMRQFNLPLPGVTSRDFMPQPSGDIQPILHLLESGRLNFRAPVMARLG